MLEQLEVVQQIVAFLGLSEQATAVALDVVRMLAGALGWQATLTGWRISRWLILPAPLEPVEVATLANLASGTYDEKKSALISSDMLTRVRDGKVEVMHAGVPITHLLSARCLRKARALLLEKQADHDRLAADLEREALASRRREIAEKLTGRKA